MKKLLFVSFLSLSIAYGYSQPDTALEKRVIKLESAVISFKPAVDMVGRQPAAITQQTVPGAPAITLVQAKMPRGLSTQQKLYVTMPIVLFALVFIVLTTWLKKDGFKLSDALQGDVPIEVEQLNTAISTATAAAAPAMAAAAAVAGAASVTQLVLPSNMPSTVTVSQKDEQDKPVLPKSSSRFIALFTGMAAIAIALCLLSYYVYFAIRETDAPNFDKLFDVVLALGIGVVPYAVNKLTQNK